MSALLQICEHWIKHTRKSCDFYVYCRYESSANLHLPHNLHFGCTFRLFLLPLRVVPVQLVEENNQSRYEIEVFIHPTCFQDAFRDVPLVRCSLRDREREDNAVHKHGFSQLIRSVDESSSLPLTLVRHLGYSWSPGRTLKEMGTLSALRLAQKASQMARCTALYTTSRPVKATKAMGRQQSSGGSSHWEPAIVTVQ